MRFDSKYVPELSASTDETRPQLCHVELDVAGKRLLATDGHRLVVIPCEPEAGDVSGPITAVALTAARKHAKAVAKAVPKYQRDKHDSRARIHANGSLAVGDESNPGPTFPRPTRDEYSAYPPVDKVIPKNMTPGSDGTVTFGINARYLAELAKAMGAENIQVTVRISDALAPVIIRTSEGSSDAPLSVCMPVRI